MLKDLKRFQGQKEEDLRRYMVSVFRFLNRVFHSICLLLRLEQLAYARCHIDWARKNLETWREAAEDVAKIEAR